MPLGELKLNFNFAGSSSSSFLNISSGRSWNNAKRHKQRQQLLRNASPPNPNPNPGPDPKPNPNPDPNPIPLVARRPGHARTEQIRPGSQTNCSLVDLFSRWPTPSWSPSADQMPSASHLLLLTVVLPPIRLATQPTWSSSSSFHRFNIDKLQQLGRCRRRRLTDPLDAMIEF